MKVLSILVALASLAATALAQINIDTPVAAVQCQPVALNWRGGTSPYYLVIIPGGPVSAAALIDLGQLSVTSFVWTVNIAAGTSITLRLTDSTGNINYSFPITILPSSNSTCIDGAAVGQSTVTSSASLSASVKVQKPTGKIEPPPSPKPALTQPEYEFICKDVAFIHNWDIHWADLPSGRTNGTYIYDCAEDLVKDKEAHATVALDGSCYPKSLEHVQAHDFFKNKGRDLAIEGCCEDLKEDNKHKKYYPEKLLDCCYDKKICVKVPKKPKCDRCHKKDDKKEEEKKY